MSIFKAMKHQKVPWSRNKLNKVLGCLWNPAWLFLPPSPVATSYYSSANCLCQENTVNGSLPKLAHRAGREDFDYYFNDLKNASDFVHVLWAKNIFIFNTMLFFRARCPYFPHSFFDCWFCCKKNSCCPK